MRVLQINVSYGHGSTGRIVETLHHEYQKMGHESFVLFGRGKRVSESNVYRTGFLWEAKLWRAISMLTGDPYAGAPLSTWNLKRNIEKIRPDVVHIHCINGNMCSIYSLLWWLKKRGYKTLITHHAMFMFTGGCGLVMCDGNKHGCGNCPHKREFFGRLCADPTKRIYRKWKKLSLDGPWIKHRFVSPWLMEQAKRSDFMKDADCGVIFNPIDVSVFNDAPRKEDHMIVVKKPFVFFPASLKGSQIKGAQWIEPIAKLLEPKGIKVIVTEGTDKQVPNVIDVGHITSPALMAAYYRNALATLVLSSVESFSMPVAESICCGTPVVGFKAGAPETIETYGNAVFTEYGDVDSLAKAVFAFQNNQTAKPKKNTSDIYCSTTIARLYFIDCTHESG